MAKTSAARCRRAARCATRAASSSGICADLASMFEESFDRTGGEERTPTAPGRIQTRRPRPRRPSPIQLSCARRGSSNLALPLPAPGKFDDSSADQMGLRPPAPESWLVLPISKRIMGRGSVAALQVGEHAVYVLAGEADALLCYRLGARRRLDVLRHPPALVHRLSLQSRQRRTDEVAVHR